MFFYYYNLLILKIKNILKKLILIYFELKNILLSITKYIQIATSQVKFSKFKKDTLVLKTNIKSYWLYLKKDKNYQKNPLKKKGLLCIFLIPEFISCYLLNYFLNLFHIFILNQVLNVKLKLMKKLTHHILFDFWPVT
jgi:hypothetical protein